MGGRLGGGGGRWGVGVGGQSGCERRNKVFVKIQKKNKIGGGVGGGSGRVGGWGGGPWGGSVGGGGRGRVGGSEWM